MSSIKRCAEDIHETPKKTRTDTYMDCSSSSSTVWQDDTLTETNLHMLENEIMCDVTFLAGEKREPVSAHKFMLVSRSPVFYAMFCGPLAESQSEIPVPDIEADIFKILIRFLYTTRCNPTNETVFGILYSSKKYQVEQLERDCLDYLEGTMNYDNVCTVLQIGVDFDEQDLIWVCLRYVFDHETDVLNSEGFLSLSKEALRMILELDDFFEVELTIYQACLKWARYQLSEAGKPTTDNDIRESLGDLLYLIRFPLMSHEDFTVHVSQTNILTDTEKIAIFQNHTLKRDNVGQFSCRRRWDFQVDCIINRFSKTSKLKSDWQHTDSALSVLFTCSENAILSGIILCTPSLPGTLEGRIEVMDAIDGNIGYYSKHIRLEYSETTSTEMVTVDPPVKVRRGQEYQIIQTCHGQVTYYGRDFDKTIVAKGLEVEFHTESENAGFNTDKRNDARNGPICGLRFK